MLNKWIVGAWNKFYFISHIWKLSPCCCSIHWYFNVPDPRKTFLLRRFYACSTSHQTAENDRSLVKHLQTFILRTHRISQKLTTKTRNTSNQITMKLKRTVERMLIQSGLQFFTFMILAGMWFLCCNAGVCHNSCALSALAFLWHVTKKNETKICSAWREWCSGHDEAITTHEAS